MTAAPYLSKASERVTAERTAVTEKRRGYAEFASRLADLSTTTVPFGATSAPRSSVAISQPTTDGAARIRAAFDETIRSEGTDSLVGAIRDELGDSLAVALAPSGDATLTPQLKRTVGSAIERRLQKTAVMERALSTETEALEEYTTAVRELREWLVEADQTPLSDCGFEELRRRYDRLREYSQQFDRLLQQRQTEIQGVTSLDGEAGLTHRSLVDSLYDGLAVDHPVLWTLCRLRSLCETCQRPVRAHLVRRV